MPLFRKVKGLAKDYRITFEYDGPLSGLETVAMEVVLGRQKDVCSVSTNYIQHGKTSVLMLHMTTLARGFEDLDANFQALRKRLQDLASYRLKILGRELLSIGLSKFQYVKYIDNTFQTVNKSCMYSPVAMNDLQFCDALLFNHSFTSAQQEPGIVVINGITFKPSEYLLQNNGTVVYIHICKEMAKKRFAQFSFDPDRGHTGISDGERYGVGNSPQWYVNVPLVMFALVLAYTNLF